MFVCLLHNPKIGAIRSASQMWLGHLTHLWRSGLMHLGLTFSSFTSELHRGSLASHAPCDWTQLLEDTRSHFMISIWSVHYLMRMEDYRI